MPTPSRGGRPFGYGDAKTMLLAKIDAYFAPARERRKQLERDPGIVEEVLRDGAARARAEVAQVTMRLVRERRRDASAAGVMSSAMRSRLTFARSRLRASILHFRPRANLRPQLSPSAARSPVAHSRS